MRREGGCGERLDLEKSSVWGCLISQYDHISQLKLLVLFLLLALVLNKSRYVLKKNM